MLYLHVVESRTVPLFLVQQRCCCSGWWTSFTNRPNSKLSHNCSVWNFSFVNYCLFFFFITDSSSHKKTNSNGRFLLVKFPVNYTVPSRFKTWNRFVGSNCCTHIRLAGSMQLINKLIRWHYKSETRSAVFKWMLPNVFNFLQVFFWWNHRQPCFNELRRPVVRQKTCVNAQRHSTLSWAASLHALRKKYGKCHFLPIAGQKFPNWST